jgi:hypothetical protein
MESAALGFVALVDHEKVKSASQAGHQRQHEYHDSSL